MAVTDPDGALAGHLRVRRREGDEGFSFGAPEKKLGIKGSPTREVYFDDVRIPADRMIGEEGTGFATAHGARSTTPASPSRAQARRASRRARSTSPSATSRSASSSARRSRSSRALQFMLADMAMKLEAARQMRLRRRREARARRRRT